MVRPYTTSAMSEYLNRFIVEGSWGQMDRKEQAVEILLDDDTTVEYKWLAKEISGIKYRYELGEIKGICQTNGLEFALNTSAGLDTFKIAESISGIDKEITSIPGMTLKLIRKPICGDTVNELLCLDGYPQPNEYILVAQDDPVINDIKVNTGGTTCIRSTALKKLKDNTSILMTDYVPGGEIIYDSLNRTTTDAARKKYFEEFSPQYPDSNGVMRTYAELVAAADTTALDAVHDSHKTVPLTTVPVATW